ncbi:3424_t:CDS:1, partial [Funneliformis geosporum]
KYGLSDKFTLVAVETKTLDHFFTYKKQKFGLDNNENEYLISRSNTLDSGVSGSDTFDNNISGDDI